MKTEDKAAEVTLQQCKDKVAEKCGYTSWGAFVSYEIKNYATTSFWKFLDEAAELYASQVSAPKDREYTEMYNQMEKALSEQSGVINQQAVTISDQSKTIELMKEETKLHAEEVQKITVDRNRLAMDTISHEKTIEELKKNSQSVFSKVKDLLAWRQTKDGKVVIKTSVQTCDELIDCITNLDKALNS